MAITFVGSATAQVIDGGSLSVTIPAARQQGDLVLFITAASNAGGGRPDSAGWLDWSTGLEIVVSGSIDTSNDPRQHLQVAYKVMGASPDTTATTTGSAILTDSTVGLVLVFRGVDTTTPLDVAGTSALGSSTNPDPPAITPTSNNCCIIACAGANNLDTTPGTITSYSTVVTNAANDTRASTGAAAYRILSGGAGASEDPAAFSTWINGQWGAITLALRPAATAITLPAAAGSYTLTGVAAAFRTGFVEGAGSYTLTGSAAAFRTGFVEGAGAYTITGAAAALRLGLGAAAGSYTLTGSPATFTFTDNRVLAAAAGAYVITGAAAAFQIGGNFALAADPGAYVITGSPANFTLGGNVTLTAGAGAYTITGSPATFVITGAPPIDAGGGYTGGRAGPLYRTRKLRRERKREELEELLELVRAQIPAPTEPDAPPPPLPSGLALTDLMERAQLTATQRTVVRRAVVSDEEDDDEEAIALLLELLA